MSENSFENSTYSENNSYDEASSNPPPESLHSPTNRVDDDFGSVGGATAAAAATAGVYGSRLTSDLLTSLPVLSSTSSNSAQPYRTSYIKDAELSELLVRKQPKFVPQAPKCAKCAKNVYKAEEIRAANKTFHKLCFKCTACNKLLEPNILTEHAGDLFCKNCYAKNFGPKGYGVGLAMPATSPDASFSSPSPSSSSSSATSSPSLASPQAAVATSNSSASSSTSSLSNGSSSSSSASSSSALKWTFSSVPTSNGTKTTTTTAATISSACNHEKRMSHSGTNGSGPVVITTGEANKCARCTKPVYAAEKVNAAGKTYHKLCFNCASCKKMLSSMNCCDNSEGDVFCKSCYGRQYGPKGVGYGVSAGALQANS